MVFGRKPKEEPPPEAEIADVPEPAPDASPDAALYDDLGMFHLWYLERRLREELLRAARVDGIFSLVCWRLRGLPGESLSDEQVRKAAGIIAKRTRAYDIFARIDEQRFVAILFECDEHAAATVAFRIKGDLQVSMQTTGRWQAGVATFPEDGMDGNSLIQTAFRRLESDALAA